MAPRVSGNPLLEPAEMQMRTEGFCWQLGVIEGGFQLFFVGSGAHQSFFLHKISLSHLCREHVLAIGAGELESTADRINFDDLHMPPADYQEFQGAAPLTGMKDRWDTVKMGKANPT
jgi:hypothetical protein